MFSVAPEVEFDHHWQGQVAEYVTTIAWTADGKTIGFADANGGVYLLNFVTLDLVTLQAGSGRSVDCLGFSHDGQLLAAAGQDGTVRIWQMQLQPKLLTTLENGSLWINRLTWHPHKPHLAFQFGFSVQVWDAAAGAIIETLPLEATAQDIQWHPEGNILAIAVKNDIRIWQTTDWEAQPPLPMAAPAHAIAWARDGQFLAAGNLDRTLLVWDWANQQAPWKMRGFPGKVRQLAWSADPTVASGAPMLVATSIEGVVTWEKDADEAVGWNGQVLELHEARIEAIAFQPGSLLLATAAQDGRVALWAEAKALGLTLEGTATGFSCLAWHPQGDYLAAGGESGELLIWAQSRRARVFANQNKEEEEEERDRATPSHLS